MESIEELLDTYTIDVSGRLFVAKLIYFCLGRRGLRWPFHYDVIGRRIGNPNIAFNQTIGDAVLIASNTFQESVQPDRDTIWYVVQQFPDTFYRRDLWRVLNGIADAIYPRANEIENTYIFLAIVVGVAVRSIENNRPEIITILIEDIPLILDSKLRRGLSASFREFFRYACDHTPRIPGYCKCLHGPQEP